MRTSTVTNSFGARSLLGTAGGDVGIYRLSALSDAGVGRIERLPFCIKVLLEAVLRNLDGFTVTEDDVSALAAWDARSVAEHRW